MGWPERICWLAIAFVLAGWNIQLRSRLLEFMERVSKLEARINRHIRTEWQGGDHGRRN